MKNIILAFLASLILVTACGQSRPSENVREKIKTEKAEDMEAVFSPDSSINNRVFLHNPSSTMKTLGDVIPLIHADKDLPDTYFKTQGEDAEYLRVVFFPGNESNSISQFEVGYSANLSDTISLNTTDIKSLKTESGIKLGMTRQELVAIKGDSFIEESTKEGTTLIYSIDDPSFPFLRRYNMPIYIAKYSFRNGKLDVYRFGFEYP